MPAAAKAVLCDNMFLCLFSQFICLDLLAFYVPPETVCHIGVRLSYGTSQRYSKRFLRD